jgi:phospholipid transport system substrate-binding protein
MMKKLSINLMICLFLLLPAVAFAGAPTEAVRTNVNKVLDILRDPALKAPSTKETKKAKLRMVYDRMFDKTELSKRALAKNWNSFNNAQREEFIQLFRQVLEKAYMDKILDYANEKVVFDKESMISGNQAEVQTRIVSSSKTIPIAYRLINKGGGWKVYDVVIENVSLVQNYRSQFNQILANNNPERLLQDLRKKVKET